MDLFENMSSEKFLGLLQFSIVYCSEVNQLVNIKILCKNVSYVWRETANIFWKLIIVWSHKTYYPKGHSILQFSPKVKAWF